MNEKQLLRRAIRSRYPGAEERNRQSAAICTHVLASGLYRQCDALCGYVPMTREADVTPILMDALRSGRTLLLPRVEEEGRMTLRLVGSLEELIPGAYGIPEPSPEAPVACLTEETLLLVPLEGLDRGGVRLGKGGGYYDRLMADCRCPHLGILQSWQWAERVPCEPWDIRLAFAADPSGIIRL